MQKQNEWSLQQWNMTNEYNDPASQVQRIRDAGLNPLFYGLDGNSANAFESAEPLGYERSTMPLIGNPVEAALDARLKNAQVDNVNADTAKKNNENITETERRQNIIKERDEMQARIDKYKSEENLNDKTAAKIDQEMERYNEYMDSIINRNNSAAALDDSQRNRIEELLPGEKELQNLSIQDYAKKWAKWEAEIRHMFAQDKLLAKQAKYYLLSLLTSGVYGSGLSAVNGLVLSEIDEDPDLTPQEKEKAKEPFLPKDKDDKKGSKDPRDYSQYDGSGWSKGNSPYVDEGMSMNGYDNR